MSIPSIRRISLSDSNRDTNERERIRNRNEQQGIRRVAAFGNFDGLHRGHQEVLKKVVDAATSIQGEKRSLISLYPHPLVVLGRVSRLPPMLSLRQRLRILSDLGIEELCLLRFNKAMANLSATDFATHILRKRLGVDILFVGPEAFFGKDREANAHTMAQLYKDLGGKLEVVSTLLDSSQKIGSRVIRDYLAEGDLPSVTRLLGRFFAVDGRVRKGDGRGRTIGVPTANLAVGQRLLPPHGVYASWCFLNVEDRGASRPENHCAWYPAVTNIGTRPTFNGSTRTIETHILSYSGPSLYGKRVELALQERLRDERKFGSVDELRTQISADIEEGKRRLKIPPSWTPFL